MKSIVILKRSLIIAIIFLALFNSSSGQEFGLSFSYFFPKNGSFSNPISPFSLRGLGVNFNDYFGVETGVTLYRMAGMNIKNLPFESDDPLMGPFFSVLVPVSGVISLGSENQVFELKGGIFVYYNFGGEINAGHMDRALVEFTGLDVVNSNLDFENSLGFGYQFGADYTFYVNDKFGITVGGTYFIGDSKLDLAGTLTGSDNNLGIQTIVVDYQDAKLDFTGFELSIGVVMASR